MDTRTRGLVFAGITGAVYAALTMLLAPLSYGAVQFRLSEILCILPFFCPAATAGLTAGCALANLMSAAGILDIVFGSLATLLAGLCTARLGAVCRREGTLPGLGRCVLSCAMPVLFNGPMVGAVLAWTLTPDSFAAGFWLFGLQVALGEAGVMFCVGVPMMRRLAGMAGLQRFFLKNRNPVRI